MNGDIVAIEFPFEVRARRRRRARERGSRSRRRRARARSSTAPSGPTCEGGNVARSAVRRASCAERRSRQAALRRRRPSFETTRAQPDATRGGGAKPCTLIPYYLWANRGAGEMSVWLPTREYRAGRRRSGRRARSSTSIPNYAKDGWRYLEAAPFDQSAGAKWGCFRRADCRRARNGDRHRQTEHARHPRRLHRCRHRCTLCANLTSTASRGWFLPSRDELALMYKNLKATGVSDFGDARCRRQLHLLDVDRSRRPTWQTTSTSRISDASTTTTRTSRAAFRAVRSI